jgi:hypothetical protein
MLFPQRDCGRIGQVAKANPNVVPERTDEVFTPDAREFLGNREQPIWHLSPTMNEAAWRNARRRSGNDVFLAARFGCE